MPHGADDNGGATSMYNAARKLSFISRQNGRVPNLRFRILAVPIVCYLTITLLQVNIEKQLIVAMKVHNARTLAHVRCVLEEEGANIVLCMARILDGDSYLRSCPTTPSTPESLIMRLHTH